LEMAHATIGRNGTFGLCFRFDYLCVTEIIF
jgi:hypothetical protein